MCSRRPSLEVIQPEQRSCMPTAERIVTTLTVTLVPTPMPSLQVNRGSTAAALMSRQVEMSVSEICRKCKGRGTHLHECNGCEGNPIRDIADGPDGRQRCLAELIHLHCTRLLLQLHSSLITQRPHQYHNIKLPKHSNLTTCINARPPTTLRQSVWSSNFWPLLEQRHEQAAHT